MIGRNVQQKEGYQAFIPEPFPTKELFSIDPSIVKKDAEASHWLGKLDGITQLLPDVAFFISMYVRKDATASSQIEGTKATLADALEAEAKIESTVPNDADDILHYIKALNYGMQRLENFPLALRFIREIHKELMQDARATHFSDPGNFRHSQNWINGKNPADAEFVPPPVKHMDTALNELEKFIHSENTMLPLIKTALIHAQFETVHPFLDGNGRTGRMLITFYLWKEGLLEKPVLFLSSYFKKYKKIYYQRLTDYREGNVNKWLEFFLDGVIETSQAAIETVRKITLLRERDIVKISVMNKTSSVSAMKILPKLFAQPIVTVALIQQWSNFNTRTGAQKLINRLVDINILKIKDEDAKYGRTYVYREYLDIFEKSLT
ncbi:MAG: Filamentation induced by cAMP protein Fic [uncultured bacterium]|nr:MAG: Filamentation induced by cAMP protein Fic [uncultured bacterium]